MPTGSSRPRRRDRVDPLQRTLADLLIAHRGRARLSQEELAGRINFSRGAIAGVESCHRIMSEQFWIACDGELDAGGRLLAAYQQLDQARVRQRRQLQGAHAAVPEDPSVATAYADQQGSEGEAWLERRDFLAQAAALAAGGAMPALASILAAGASADISVSTAVGPAHVQAIEDVTRAFREADNRCGGGSFRPAMLVQLREVLALHDGSLAAGVRPQLCAATAGLACLAAWTSYDIEDHEQARRLWMLALGFAREADRTEGITEALSSLAHQSLHLGRPREALRLVRTAQASIDDVYSPASLGGKSLLASMAAWCYAAEGQTRACERELGLARDHFTDVAPRGQPDWIGWFDEAELAGLAGHTYYVAATNTDGSERTQLAGRAVDLLGTAARSYDEQYVRTRAVNLAGLAGSYFLHGDVDAAVAAGHESMNVLERLNSPRAWDRARAVRRHASSYLSEPEVAELTERITVLADVG